MQHQHCAPQYWRNFVGQDDVMQSGDNQVLFNGYIFCLASCKSSFNSLFLFFFLTFMFEFVFPDWIICLNKSLYPKG